jgi:hypothetical protein
METTSRLAANRAGEGGEEAGSRDDDVPSAASVTAPASLGAAANASSRRTSGSRPPPPRGRPGAAASRIASLSQFPTGADHAIRRARARVLPRRSDRNRRARPPRSEKQMAVCASVGERRGGGGGGGGGGGDEGSAGKGGDGCGWWTGGEGTSTSRAATQRARQQLASGSEHATQQRAERKKKLGRRRKKRRVCVGLPRRLLFTAWDGMIGISLRLWGWGRTSRRGRGTGWLAGWAGPRRQQWAQRGPRGGVRACAPGREDGRRRRRRGLRLTAGWLLGLPPSPSWA